jgi:molybdate transport system ATP-binding protein
MTAEIFLRHRFGAFALDMAFVMRGGVTALFGPSGSGKSSVVSAIAGLLRPRNGRIALDGRVLLDSKARIFVPAEARRIAVVFQDARLFPHMDVENNLLFGWRRAPQKADAATISHVVELLGLGTLLRRRPHRLSGGEKSRVALGRALLASPQMLLLDEPLASLDAERRHEILPYLERLARESKLPMLYVSHAVDEVARLADEIVVLRDGHVTAQGAVFDLLTDVDAIAGVPPLGAVFDAKVAGTRDGLSLLAFDGGVLAVKKLSLETGACVRVRLRAEDIMLAREEPRAISANNVLSCVVRALRTKDGEADVQLLCGATKLVARITDASRVRLSLEPGASVFAIVKSVTVGRQG